MRRVNRSYDSYARRASNPTYTVLKPPEGGDTDVPRRESVVALSGSYEELRTIKRVLNTLTQALPQNATTSAQNHEKTHRWMVDVNATLQSLLDEVRPWMARTDKRIDRIERILARPVPEPEQPPTTAPFVALAEQHATSEPSSGNGDGGESPLAASKEQQSATGEQNGPSEMSTVLMSAFQAELGGPTEPTTDDYESLEVVFDLALQEAQKPQLAVEQFGFWLSRFREITSEHPAMERTPRGFVREVSARRL